MILYGHARRFHLRLQESLALFGNPVVEETPRTQYGATAYGVLGETVDEASRTLFSQPEPPLPSHLRKDRDPTIMDPSTFIKSNDGAARLDERRPHVSMREGVQREGSERRGGGQVQAALDSMHRPIKDPQPGSHLYESLGTALRHTRPGTLFGSPSEQRVPPYPPLYTNSNQAGWESPDRFLQVDAGLSSSARRLLQIPPPLLPPVQPPSVAFLSGGYYAPINGYGRYGDYGAAFAASSQSSTIVSGP